MGEGKRGREGGREEGRVGERKGGREGGRKEGRKEIEKCKKIVLLATRRSSELEVTDDALRSG